MTQQPNASPTTLWVLEALPISTNLGTKNYLQAVGLHVLVQEVADMYIEHEVDEKEVEQAVAASLKLLSKESNNIA